LHEPPRERFNRDERTRLQALPAPRYTSLVLDAPAAAPPTPQRSRPVIPVEKPPLTRTPVSREGSHECRAAFPRDRLRQILADLHMPGRWIRLVVDEIGYLPIRRAKTPGL
jgi:hypothetical protein